MYGKRPAVIAGVSEKKIYIIQLYIIDNQLITWPASMEKEVVEMRQALKEKVDRQYRQENRPALPMTDTVYVQFE